MYLKNKPEIYLKSYVKKLDKKIEAASTSRLKAMKTIKQCSENRKLETIISLKSRGFYPRAFCLSFY